MKLSAYIVTLNEEKRLPRTLTALKQVADEIIIVDSGSTDKTEEIAKQFGAKFLFHKWENISFQKHFAQEQCSNEWILTLDADEVLSPQLIEEIKTELENPRADVYKIKIKDMAPKAKKPRIGARTYNLERLYNRKFANMPEDLTHDRLVVQLEAKVAQLKGIIHHYSYQDLYQLWFKLNMYTEQLVNTAITQKRSFSLFRLATEFPRQFLVYYFKRGYIFDGKFGFVMSVSYAYFRFLKIAKWFERKYFLNEEK